jgi:hypothetical protein
MRINKTVKILALIILSIFLILFIVLVVHIATAKPVINDNTNLQISRIDFKQPLDSAMVKEIHRNLKSIDGLKNYHFNMERGVVVYYHDNRVINADKVFNQLMAKGDYKATPFVISTELASRQVCPVMNRDDFSYKFSRGIKRIFN